MIYVQQRYYDEDIGRFLSVDPVTAYDDPIAQFHRYRYANSNPDKFTDPGGRQFRENVDPPSTGVPRFDWLMNPSDGRGSTGQLVGEQLVSEFSKPHGTENVVLYTVTAMSLGTGVALRGVAGRVSANRSGNAVRGGLESRGYRPVPGERTIQGQVDSAVSTANGNPTIVRNGNDVVRLRSSGHGKQWAISDSYQDEHRSGWASFSR
ncbi:RHS repeat-associated core domain-containing protein [Marilutibacter maris]|uniref:RHS repeat-associated core domain-containing protein n=1 Tax=Marilutibacter maris TaxID=1605891 RepID=UPI001CB9BC1C|nr:RHS repeat-associated core domain-containing protein [Lysobacter maris]